MIWCIPFPVFFVTNLIFVQSPCGLCPLEILDLPLKFYQEVESATLDPPLL